MKAWMPGEAKYVTARIERANDLQDIFYTVVEQMIQEMGGVPDEWRWEIDGNAAVLMAAKAVA